MQTLTLDQFRNLRLENEDLVVINVLPKTHFVEGHIPGSINIPLETNQFEREVERRAGGKSAMIVVYCAHTACDASPKAAKRLEDDGVQEVFDFEGGTRAWRDAGYEIQSGAAEAVR